MDRRDKYESCYGPYRWSKSENGVDYAKCADPYCTRDHQDHVRKLNQDETVTDSCLICMEDH